MCPLFDFQVLEFLNGVQEYRDPSELVRAFESSEFAPELEAWFKSSRVARRGSKKRIIKKFLSRRPPQ